MPVQKVPVFKAGAIGNVYRCTIIGNGNYGKHNNTFHLRQSLASFTGDIFDDIKVTWDGAVKASYLALFSSSFTLEAMRVAQVDDSLKGLPAETLTLTGSGTRTVSGQAQPGQLAGVLEFNSGFSGRRGRGRNFIGEMFEGDQNIGVVESALRTLYETYGNTLRTTFDGVSAVGELVVFTLVTNQVAPVLSVRAKLPVYTQRRRREGVGS